METAPVFGGYCCYFGTVIVGISVLLLFPKAQTKSPSQFQITSHLITQ